MEVPVNMSHLEVTDDYVDSKSPVDFDEAQQSPLPKKTFSPKSFTRSFESKPMKKDFSKPPYWYNKPLLKCQHCSFKSYYLAGYKRHVKVHDKNANVSIPGRIYKQTSDALVEQALLNRQSNRNIYGRFKCHLCSYISKRRSTHINHKAVIHGLNIKGHPLPKNAFWCQDCDFICTSEPTLDRHVEEQHPDRITSHKQRFKCNECEFNTTYRPVLDRHKNGHLPAGDSLTCTICGVMAGDEDSFQKHLQRHGATRTSKPATVAVNPEKKPADKYTCDICGYYNSTPSRVVRHRAVHAGIKPFSCPFCPSRFAYKYNMGAHVETVHKKSKSIVYGGPDYLEDESNLNEVGETTSSDAPKNVATICILAQDSGNSSKLLETGLEDSLTYGCSMCSFTFNIRAEAMFHCELTHKDRLPMLYQCSICNHVAQNFILMVRHLRKHLMPKTEPGETCEANDRPRVGLYLFFCAQCDLKFASKEELKRHKRNVHNISGTLFKCSKCEYISLDRSDVTQHLRATHGRGGKSK